MNDPEGAGAAGAHKKVMAYNWVCQWQPVDLHEFPEDGGGPDQCKVTDVRFWRGWEGDWGEYGPYSSYLLRNCPILNKTSIVHGAHRVFNE